MAGRLIDCFDPLKITPEKWAESGPGEAVRGRKTARFGICENTRFYEDHGGLAHRAPLIFSLHPP
jgi:hypothetical protein